MSPAPPPLPPPAPSRNGSPEPMLTSAVPPTPTAQPSLTASPAQVPQPDPPAPSAMQSSLRAPTTAAPSTGLSVDSVVAAAVSPAPPSPAPSYREAVTGRADQSISPQAPKERTRGLLPHPDALAAVRRLYAGDQQDPKAILDAAKAAQPEAIQDAPYSISARVSSSLFGVSRPAMVLGLAAVKDNEVVRSVLDSGDIVHIHRQPRNTVMLFLRSELAKQRLAGQRCQFLGRTLTFDSLNPLSDAFYIDVLGIRSGEFASNLFKGFLAAGCQPVYFNFTYRAPRGAITSGIVRYYFDSSQCPSSLVIDGQVCDQIVLGGLLHSARARGATAVQYFLNPSKPSPHALHFGLDGSVLPIRTTPRYTPVVSGSKRARESSAGSAAPSDSVSEPAVPPSAMRGGPDGDVTVTPVSPAEVASPSPAPSTEVFRAPPRKRTARRTPGQVYESPRAFYSPNYWADLEGTGVQLRQQSVVLDGTDAGLRITVASMDIPATVRSSTEHAHFTEVRRSRVVCSAHPTTIASSLSLLDEDIALQEAAALREIEDAAQKLDLTPTRAESNAVTTDDLDRCMRKNRVHFLGKLFRLMRLKAPLVDDYIRVHLISRAVHASGPLVCTSVADKWSQLFQERCPRSRSELFSQADRWMLDTSEHDLYAASEALAFFELLVMTAAPDIFGRDAWLHVICGFDSPWIGSSPVRLLHPNILLSLLRSELGARLMAFVEASGWDHACLHRLKDLQSSSVWMPEEGGVLLIAGSSLGPVWAAGALVLSRP